MKRPRSSILSAFLVASSVSVYSSSDPWASSFDSNVLKEPPSLLDYLVRKDEGSLLGRFAQEGSLYPSDVSSAGGYIGGRNQYRDSVTDKYANLQAMLSKEDGGYMLHEQIEKLARKTGTTIAGLVIGDSVVLGADTRSTNGMTVAEKNCEKIHKLASNIYCCGAGTSADCDQLTRSVRLALLEMQRLYQDTSVGASRVSTANGMFQSTIHKSKGGVSVALILGGVDSSGPHLHAINAQGNSDAVPFAALGSGTMAALSTLECGYREDLSEEQAIELVCAAVTAGIENDLGSGSNVDICVIRPSSTDYYRPYQRKMNPKGRKFEEQSASLDRKATIFDTKKHEILENLGNMSIEKSVNIYRNKYVDVPIKSERYRKRVKIAPGSDSKFDLGDIRLPLGTSTMHTRTLRDVDDILTDSIEVL